MGWLFLNQVRYTYISSYYHIIYHYHYMKSTSRQWVRRLRQYLTLSFIVCCLLLQAQEEKYYRIEAEVSREQLPELFEAGLEMDHAHFDGGWMHAEVSGSDLKILRKNKIKLKVTLRDLEKRIPKHNRKVDKAYEKEKLSLSSVTTAAVATPTHFELGSMGGFFTLNEIIDEIDEMSEEYPNLITVKESIGTSIEGRDIYMLKISDNPNVDEPENEAFLNAIHHAREPMGVSQLIFFMWHILENYDTDPELKALIDHTELYFVPVINPDGYVRNQATNPNGGGLWRKNRRVNSNGSIGVDLNRNYGFEWAYDNSGSSGNGSSQTYRGASAFSEPETQAIRDFVNEHEFIAALNYHSYGNLLIYPWGYRPSFVTPDDPTFQTMSVYMTEENGYTYGTGDQTVGYVVNGDSDDWMYGEQTSKPKMFSMTPEVGAGSDGFWPASSRIIPLCNEAFPLNLKLMQMVAEYAKVTPENTSISNPLLTGTIPFDIRRFSLNSSAWTVSLSSSSSLVNSTGASLTFDNLNLLASASGSLTYTLDEDVPNGAVIPFVITVDNGSWSTTQTVTVVYTGNSDGTCPVPTGLSVSGVTASSATATWTQTGAPSYTARYREEGTASWATVSVSGSSAVLTSLTPLTAYEVQVRSNCGSDNFSAFTSSASFTTLENIVTYCSSSANNANEEYIARVQLGSLDNSSGGGNGYSDFRSVSTGLSIGSTQTISITAVWEGTVYREGYAVWIDYNRDGDFSDSGERVWAASATTNSPVSGSFTVPSGVLPGATVMRVTMRYNTIPGPCGTFNYGEVEDYTVNLTNTASVAVVERNNNDGAQPTVSALEEIISVFPSPVNDLLKVESPKTEEARYFIYNIKGEVVKEGTLKGSGPIDVSGFLKGTYTLQVGNYEPVRFLKE